MDEKYNLNWYYYLKANQCFQQWDTFERSSILLTDDLQKSCFLRVFKDLLENFEVYLFINEYFYEGWYIQEAVGYLSALHLLYIVIGSVLLFISLYGKIIYLSLVLFSSMLLIAISGTLAIIGAHYAQKFPLALLPLRVWQVSQFQL